MWALLFAHSLLMGQSPLSTTWATMPEPPLPSLAPLLPERELPVVPAVPAFATAEAHRRALLDDPLHTGHFWVEGLLGDPQGRRVVFVIPQFHRNPGLPLEWTSLGGAIAEVQQNIDILVSRLHSSHGLRCVGTEGSWLEHIRYPFELRQPAQWRTDLAVRRRIADGVLLAEAVAGREHTAKVERLLDSALRRRVSLYDGVGVALYRTDPDRGVHRFGLEDASLNREALRLLAALQAIDEELALLAPADRSEVQSAMGLMWLDEYPAYERDVLQPLDRSLGELDAVRLRLLAEGAEDAAEDVGRFVVLAKHIQGAVLRPEEVRRLQRHYHEVEERAATPVPARPPVQDAWGDVAPGSKGRHAELVARRAPLQQAYDEVTIDARERYAARRLLEKLGPSGSCAMVMGAAHKDALAQRLLELGGGDLAVLLVAPYSFGATSEGTSP
ncbi:MAG: hypothetical protein ACO3JL_04425 [Myxococcota bacterium]